MPQRDRRRGAGREDGQVDLVVTEGDRNYIYKVCLDPKTNKLVYIKEEVA